MVTSEADVGGVLDEARLANIAGPGRGADQAAVDASGALVGGREEESHHAANTAAGRRALLAVGHGGRALETRETVAGRVVPGAAQLAQSSACAAEAVRDVAVAVDAQFGG